MLNNCLKIVHLFKNALLGTRCVLCKTPVKLSPNPNPNCICKDCQRHLPWRDSPSCPQCGNPSWGELCGQCLTKPPYFDQTIAAFHYRYPVEKLIAAYKYRQQQHIALPLAQALIVTLAQQLKQRPDIIIAMPMHALRVAERGFNQSFELAKMISLALHIPLQQCCRRIIHTPPQAGLDAQQRIRNIRGAFSCEQDIRGLKIAIVDDVMTTGASLNELARQLKQHGAAHVQCWLVARTEHHD